MQPKPHILPTIILAQFACTSPWFAGNAIIKDLIYKTGLGSEIMGYVISSVQFGFITGTLIFGLLMVADRFSPSNVFMVCALLAALCNLCLLLERLSTTNLVLARFGTGFFLAGIYPVGMKIAADYYKKGLGKALGFLVGALVFGTAFPYVINGTPWGQNPDMVIKITSLSTVLGGILIVLLVPNGPFRKKSSQLRLATGPRLFKIKPFRKAAFGYFGHMWELYAFWAFTPFAIDTFNRISGASIPVSLSTSIVIMLGGVSCGLGGLVSQKWGSENIARTALLFSAVFCLVSPFFFKLSPPVFLILWCLWGMAVTADSPQFSNMVASSIPSESKGTGLTLVNCIGFAITIVSIQLLLSLSNTIEPTYIFMALSVGPVLGVWQLWYQKKE